METIKKLRWPIAAFVVAIILLVVGDAKEIPTIKAAGGVGVILSVAWAAMKWQNIELLKELRKRN